MIIFGTTGITSTQQRGSFHCPSCGAGAPFERKGVRRFFTLFFVPLIPLHQVADFIECKRCGGTFKPEILTWNGTVPPPLPSGTPPPLHSDPFGNIAGTPPAYPAAGAASATTLTFQANGAAKASMILGIVGLVTSVFICPSFLFIIASIVLGIVGLSNVKKGNGLVAGKNAAIAGIVCSIVGALVMVGMTIVAARNPGTSGKSSPRQAASSKISGSSTITGHGNSPKARELAEKYAIAMQLWHSLSISSENSRAGKTRYVVYCELHENTCAFLAYVPDSRRFADDAKSSLESMAWSTATQLLKEDETVQKNTELCIALKGLVMFGAVMVGDSSRSAPNVSNKDESMMDRFFPESPEVEVSNSKGEPAGKSVGKDEL